MTKKTTITTFFIFIFGITLSPLNAQIFFTETFEGTMGANGIPAGWSETGLSTDGIFTVGDAAAASSAYVTMPVAIQGTKFAYTNDDACNCTKSADRLILPTQNFTGMAGVTLIYDLFHDGSYGGIATVEVSTGGTTGPWTTVATLPLFPGAWQNNLSLSLGTYAGQSNITIAFRYNDVGVWAGAMAVDEVRLEQLLVLTPEVSITGVTPREYTAIPKSQVTSFPVSATVNNSGTGLAASVTLTTSVFKLPNTTTPVYTGTGSIANLAAGVSATINASTAFTPSAPINGEYLFRSVISGNTGSVANDTSYYNVVVNDSVYARDKSTADNAIGVNGSGNTAILGNNFQITANATLSSVLFSTNGIGVGPALGDSTQILVYATTAGVPTGVPIASSALYIYGAADNTSPMVRTIAINGTAGLALTPGTYFVGIKEFFNTNNLGISISNGIFTPNTTYAQVGTGAWTPLENFGFPSAAIIRANFRPVCAVSVTPASQTNVSCFGGSNGAATINTPTGGTGPYTYNWTPGNPTGDGTASVTGLTAGTWICTVTDANLCTATQSFMVTQPSAAISVTAASQTNVSCFGGSNGAATVNATGGTGPYTYNWTPGNPTGDGTASVTGLTAGTWICTVTDANSCTASQSFTVTEQPGLVIPTLTTVTDQCSVSLTAPVTNNACAGTTIGTTTTVFPVTTQGTTVVTWSFDDGTGNSITVPQTVIVDDVTNPATPTLATVTGECSATVTAPTTTDNCAATITGTTTDPLTYSTQGTFTVNWTFNDGNGNSITVPQTVIVDDVTSPVGDVAALTAITECFEATPIAPTATDNCTGTVVGISNVTFPITAAGSTIVTWTYTDGNGNTSTQTQNVVINTVDNSVTQAVNLLTANATGSTYQWLDCDNGNAIIAGETNQTYTPAITGNYAVEVTQNGCVDTSACILVDYTGIENLTSTNLSVYPNPVDQQFTIEFLQTKNQEIQIEIINGMGQVIEYIENKSLENNKITISTENWATGLYTVRLHSGNELMTKLIHKM